MLPLFINPVTAGVSTNQAGGVPQNNLQSQPVSGNMDQLLQARDQIRSPQESTQGQPTSPQNQGNSDLYSFAWKKIFALIEQINGYKAQLAASASNPFAKDNPAIIANALRELQGYLELVGAPGLASKLKL